MRLLGKYAAAALMSATLIAPSWAQSSPPARTAGKKAMDNGKTNFTLPRIPVKQYQLKNGLRVVLAQDNAVPVVAAAVYYDVGSRNEKTGRTGFAHLFEHMMFQGSENVGKAMHFQYISHAGGTMNGTTSSERTNYFQALPSNQLPLALWLESDRMRSLKVTQENLDNQREAVKEEKRLRIDNQPYAPAFLQIDELIFKNPNNAHSTIGSMEDLNAATIDDVKEFFRVYYAPNNAVLVIAGDFQEAETKALVEKYFGTIPAQTKPAPVDVTEPVEVAQRDATIKDSFAPLAGFIMGWKVPARRTPDAYALEYATQILFQGDSSRLYRKLVKGAESVLQMQGGIDDRRGPSALTLFVLPKPGQDQATIRQTIQAEIQRLATEGPTPEEMEKVRNGIINDSVRGMQSAMFRAQRIAEYTLYDGDANLINTELGTFLKVTPEQVKAAVARSLATDNRVLLNIVPDRKPTGKPGE